MKGVRKVSEKAAELTAVLVGRPRPLKKVLTIFDLQGQILKVKGQMSAFFKTYF
jgi:hypothetical protein